MDSMSNLVLPRSQAFLVSAIASWFAIKVAFNKWLLATDMPGGQDVWGHCRPDEKSTANGLSMSQNGYCPSESQCLPLICHNQPLSNRLPDFLLKTRHRSTALSPRPKSPEKMGDNI